MSKRMHLFFVLVFLSFVFSCKKENKTEGVKLSEEVIMAESFFTSVIIDTDNNLRVVDDFLFGSNKSIENDCAVITIAPADTLNWPKTITIDYGDTNCLGKDNRYRRGKIIAQLPHRISDTLSFINIGFDSFYLNDNKMLGTIKYTNTGLNAENFNTFEIEISNAAVITSRGTIYWSSSQNYVYDFLNTPGPHLVNMLEATGEATGQLTNGRSFKARVIAPLFSVLSCPFIMSGLIEIISDEMPIETVNFGNNQCNAAANVTIDGKTYDLLIP